jgi:hypothetical protein
VPLELVGAGWGRTGTTSIKLALDQLGYRCHHMAEVFQRPADPPRFLAVANGEQADWENIYAGFRAAVDWPTCTFWRELADAYPTAPVLLSVRDPDGWYESFRATIYHPVVNGVGNPEWDAMVKAVIIDRDLRVDPADRDAVIAAYERHNDEVRATIPPERLCVYDVAQGWEPLCRLLGQPVPDEPFPRANTRDEWTQKRRDDNA